MTTMRGEQEETAVICIGPLLFGAEWRKNKCYIKCFDNTLRNKVIVLTIQLSDTPVRIACEHRLGLRPHSRGSGYGTRIRLANPPSLLFISPSHIH